MTPKKHPIAWLMLALIAITLLAVWIVPNAGAAGTQPSPLHSDDILHRSAGKVIR